ncbi:MAG: hypothetical protein EOO72_02950 [Myxococcaceae bacterium]|nr:MAG: hypothetical protein EOO72_02950 [Myxococcaceae bacterium]
MTKLGRPLKGPAPTEQVRSIRFTAEDCELIKTIIEHEQERVREQSGIATRLTFADVLRSLVRQEAQRRGLSVS